MAARSGHRGDLTSSRSSSQLQRLKSNYAFGAIHRRGRWLRGTAVSLGILANHRQDTRVGFRTKRGIKRAVDRNRLKRQLRAILSTMPAEFKSGVDLVMVAHPRTIPAASSVLKEELLGLLRRSGVLAHEARRPAVDPNIS